MFKMSSRHGCSSESSSGEVIITKLLNIVFKVPLLKLIRRNPDCLEVVSLNFFIHTFEYRQSLTIKHLYSYVYFLYYIKRISTLSNL